MSTLPEETPGRQRDLSALRPAVKKRRAWIWIAAVVIAIAALCDWTRPPSKQVSVVLYQNIVIKGYRLLLQPWGRYLVRCRFHPTCSVYSEQAMQLHGFPKGLWLTTSRLFRCMPWVPFGTDDPVPPLNETRNPKHEARNNTECLGRKIRNGLPFLIILPFDNLGLFRISRFGFRDSHLPMHGDELRIASTISDPAANWTT